VCNRYEEVAIEEPKLRLYRCHKCCHVFKDISSAEQEPYCEDYFTDQHKNWFDNPDYNLFKLIHDKIRELKPSGRISVLDLGCGKGHFLRYLREADPELDLYGIDIAENNSPGITFYRGDILKWEAGARFDIVTNLAVIEHLDNPRAFVGRVKALLNPDGILFTVTDNDGGMIYKAARVCRRMGIDAPYDRLYSTHHLQCFSNCSLKRLLDNGGFDLMMLRNWNHPVSAVDYPKSGFLWATIYAAAVRSIFFLSGFTNSGIMQVAVCRSISGGKK
jgi:SAM-dependent methyltransferase